eukprot:6478827-Amphidinium_carterae.1
MPVAWPLLPMVHPAKDECMRFTARRTLSADPRRVARARAELVRQAQSQPQTPAGSRWPDVDLEQTG